MIPLALVTGFLGSGKTTLLRHQARRNRDRRIVWIVNEFSPHDVDGALLAREANDVISVVGGSIFCRCKAEEFLAVLRRVPEQFQPDAVGIEASGMADPVVAGRLLRETRLDDLYVMSMVVAVVDPGSFLKLLHTLPAVRAQIAAATHVLINKIDLYPTHLLEQTERAVRALRPDVPVTRTRHGAADLDLFGGRPEIVVGGELAPCVDPHFEKFEVPLQKELDLDQLQRAVQPLREELYRLKGVARVDGRRVYLDYSLSGWQIEQAADTEAEGLVLITRGHCSDAVRDLVRRLSEQTTGPSRIS